MSAPRPLLPETTDPFTLLGVHADCDARDLKRAYVALIKHYRPDESPAEFQRIRAAFEQGRKRLRSATTRGQEAPLRPRQDAQQTDATPSALSLPADHYARSQAQAEGPQDTTEFTSSKVAPAFKTRASDPPASEESEPPREAPPFAPEVPTPKPPTRRPPAAPRAVVAPTVDAWTSALSAGQDLAPYGRDLSTELANALAQRDLLSWSVLRKQPDQAFAGETFALGAQLRSLAGDGQAVLDDLSSEAFRRDLLAAPTLERHAHLALALACWDAPEQAASILHELAPDAGNEDPNLDWLEDNLSLIPAWAACRAEVAARPAFEALLRYGLLNTERGEAHIAEALADLQAHPEAWLQSTEILQSSAPDLVRRLQVTADRRGTEDDRLWDELAEEEREELRRVVTDLEKALDSNFINSLHSWAVGALVFVNVGVFFFVGWWARLLWVLGSLVFIVVSTSKLDGILYRRLVRPVLLTRIAHHGIPPLRLAEAIATMTKLTDSIGRFGDEIRDDNALDALAGLHRARIQLGSNAATEASPGRGVCAKHPGQTTVARCKHCGRTACPDCISDDALVGAFCLDCEAQRTVAMRTRCRTRERVVHGLSMLCWLVATGLLAAARPFVVEYPMATGGLSLVAAMLGLLAIGLRARKGWARIGMLVALSPLLLAVPIGTAIAIAGLRFFRADTTKFIFEPQYKEVVRATPAMGPPRYLQALEAILWALGVGQMVLLGLALV